MKMKINKKYWISGIMILGIILALYLVLALTEEDLNVYTEEDLMVFVDGLTDQEVIDELIASVSEAYDISFGDIGPDDVFVTNPYLITSETREGVFGVDSGVACDLYIYNHPDVSYVFFHIEFGEYVLYYEADGPQLPITGAVTLVSALPPGGGGGGIGGGFGPPPPDDFINPRPPPPDDFKNPGVRPIPPVVPIPPRLGPPADAIKPTPIPPGVFPGAEDSPWLWPPCAIGLSCSDLPDPSPPWEVPWWWWDWPWPPEDPNTGT